MHSHEIPAEQWLGFFDQFSHDHAGWPVTVEVLSSDDTSPEKIARNLPLQGISFDRAGTRPSSLRIMAGDDPAANVSHVIDLPLHVRLAEKEDDSSGLLMIEPAQGETTLVHFHPPHWLHPRN
jgi:Family of unknown function (DUF5335)